MLADSPAARCGAEVLEWPLPARWMWLWALIVLSAWWLVAPRPLPATRLPLSPAAMTAAALLGRLGAQAAEAAFYVACWRLFGSRLPFWRFFCWLLSLSMFDVVGEHLRVLAAARGPALAAWLAPVAGIGLLRPVAGAPGPWAAFGNLGLLTAARVAGTAWLMARGLGRRPARPVALVAGAWLVSRVMVWWIVDLARGASPL